MAQRLIERTSKIFVSRVREHAESQLWRSTEVWGSRRCSIRTEKTIQRLFILRRMKKREGRQRDCGVPRQTPPYATRRRLHRILKIPHHFLPPFPGSPLYANWAYSDSCSTIQEVCTHTARKFIRWIGWCRADFVHSHRQHVHTHIPTPQTRPNIVTHVLLVAHAAINWRNK